MLSSQGLNADTNDLQKGTGEKVGQTIHHLVSFVGGISVGLVYGWKMGLVVLGSLPFIVLAGATMAKAQAWASDKNAVGAA